MDGDNWANTPSAFTLSGDWGKYALTGQSALLFRNGLIPTLPTQINIPLAAPTRLAIAASRDYGALETHLALRYGVTPELALQARLALDLSGTGALAVQPAAATAPATILRSPDGTIEFQPQQRTILLRTPQTRGFFGFLMTNRRVGDSLASVELLGKGRGFASILLTALDNRPLGSSHQILISAPNAVTGTQPGSLPKRPKELVRYKSESQWKTLEPDATDTNKPSGARDVEGPVWMERSEARINLRTQARQVTVYPLDGSGQRMAALGIEQVTLKNGMLSVYIQAEAAQASPWYEVIAND